MKHKVEITIEGAEVFNWLSETFPDEPGHEDDYVTYAILNTARQKDDGTYREFEGRHVLEAAGAFAQLLWDDFSDGREEEGGFNLESLADHGQTIKDIQGVIKRIGQLLDWGWIDIYPEMSTIEIADELTSLWGGDEERAHRMAVFLKEYIERQCVKTGVQWHYVSCRESMGWQRTVHVLLRAAGGQSRDLHWSGGWVKG